MSDDFLLYGMNVFNLASNIAVSTGFVDMIKYKCKFIASITTEHVFT
jgi:hypothetical protein